MEIQHARVFVALAELGTMTNAARRLSVTQPAVSFALSQFEKEIGVVLFHRSRKGLTLTTHGAQLLEQAQHFLRLADELVRSNQGRKESEGEVRIAGRPGFMQYVLPELLRILKSQAPGIHVSIALSGSSDEVVNSLRTGQADLAFAASPNMKSITAEVIYHDPVWLAVASGHPLATKRHIAPKDLSRLPLCLPVQHDRLRAPIDKFLRRVLPKPDIFLETNDYTIMRNVIQSGQCGGFVYAHMLATSDKQEILPLSVDGLSLSRDLTVLNRRDDLLPHVAFARSILIEETKRLLSRNEKRFTRKNPSIPSK